MKAEAMIAAHIDQIRATGYEFAPWTPQGEAAFRGIVLFGPDGSGPTYPVRVTAATREHLRTAFSNQEG